MLPSALVDLLRHRFTLAPLRRHCASLWHSAVALPRLAVSQHRTLRSADFPHPTKVGRNRPVDLGIVIVSDAKAILKIRTGVL